MKRLVVIIFLLFTVVATAQNISVKSFKALPTDISASSIEGKRKDQNGQVAALIKIVTTETGFIFEGGALGIVDTKQEAGEIWVWIPRASRKITIKHPQLGVLRDYLFPIEIESERTYEMVLITGRIETVVKQEVRQQYLIFQIEPKDAALEVDDQLWTVSAEGTARKFVNFGTYSYRVQASNYHPEAGKVTVNDPKNKQTVVVKLNPNFGWIEVKGGNVDGASVYVDNTYVGKAPCKTEALKSDEHTVKIAKEMYKPYSERVTVNDNETTLLSPKLVADFAKITLSVDTDAEIWVNDERKGVRTWTGNLGTGTYFIECRKASHEPTSITREINSSMDGQTIKLSAPIPIYGSLNVESSPDFAQIFIDGQAMGETPNYISELLIGQHVLKLSKKGYADFIETITIGKDENKQIIATLNNGQEIQFTCNVRNASLSIDGNVVGSASGNYFLTYGQHVLKATASDYSDYDYTINITEDVRSHNIQMKSNAKDDVSQLFPLFGITLGKSTWKDAEDLGYKVERHKPGYPDRLAAINGVYFWDHKGEGIFTQIYWVHWLNNGVFPDYWADLGFSWANSYDEWLALFRGLGYDIKVEEKPHTRVYDGRNTLSADVYCLSPDKHLKFSLVFEYGNRNNEGYSTSSPRSLYSITIEYKK